LHGVKVSTVEIERSRRKIVAWIVHDEKFGYDVPWVSGEEVAVWV
jgi:hypothetical protein